MKKIVLSLFFLLGAFFTLSAFDVFADTPVYSVDVTIQLADDTTDTLSLTDLPFGQEISFDVTAWDDESYDFLGFIIEGKVVQSIESAQSFRVTENMDVVAYFKPAGSLAVIFMDSNHDFIDVEYTGVDGKLTSIPSYAAYTKPGLTSTGWNVDDIANHVFTEDTLVYLEYENASGQKTLTYDDGSGVQTEAHDYNGLVTLEAVGENFSYWLKDNIIVSLESTYTFTMLDDHTVEAVFNDSEFVPDSQTLVTVSDMLNLRTGYDSIVGQFHLGPNEELVEWGIIASNLPGGITHDTPDVGVFNSRRYNESSQEFLMSFDNAIFSFSNYRGFVTTINTVTDVITTTYSYYQDVMSIPEYASDLIISEYGEGSSNNKWIEIYNGTGSAVDLSEYSVILYSNGSATPTNTEVLNGSLADGDTYVLYNGSSVQTIKDAGDISSAVANFNGDDAIALIKNGEKIDVFGQIGFDPGSAWSNNGITTVNQTLVRKTEITSGDSNGSDAFDPSLEWEQFAIDTFTNIGSHTMDLPTNDVYFTYTSANTPSSLTVSGDTSVNQNETIQLTSDVQNVIWVSSNPSVLTADQNGLVTGISEGVANITAYAFLDHSVNDTITITGLGLTTYDVTFDNDGVTNVVTVDGGDPVSQPTEPIKSGYVFEGWYTSSDNGVTLDTEWNFETSVQDNLTLYAKWVEISSVLDLRTNGTSAYVQGIVTGINGSNVYLNDGTAAINIYDFTLAGIVSIGDEVLFADNVTSTYNELLQFSFVSYEVLSSGNTLPAVVVLNDFSEATSDYQTQRVSISGLEVVSIVGSDLILTDQTTQISVLGLSSEFLSSVIIGQSANLVSIHVGWSNGLEFNALDDIEVELVPLSDAENVAGIKSELITDFDGSEYASNSTITLPSTSTVYGGTITWSSSNETLVNSNTGVIGEVVTNTSVTLTASIDVNGTVDSQIVTITVVPTGSITYSTDLFISEYIEGSGTTRAIEIYNNTGAAVDLSTYTITNYYNGNTTVTSAYIYQLSGTLQHGETFVLYHTSSVAAVITAAQSADLYFGSSSNYINFNGDDAIVLANDGTNIDVIGVIGTDPGSNWSVGTDSTQNHTLVRNSNVINPTTTWDTSEWTAYDEDTSSYLGTHTVNPE